MARPMPVLPLVASMTVWPGFSKPRRSASSITPSARRSFTDPIGLNASIFTYRFTCAGARLVMAPIGGRPTVPRVLSNRDLADPASDPDPHRAEEVGLADRHALHAQH